MIFINDFLCFLRQRAFSPEGLSEMWNEMVKDEEITFNGEESAHPGLTVHLCSLFLFFCFFTLQPCVFHSVVQFYSLSQDDTRAMERVRVLIFHSGKSQNFFWLFQRIAPTALELRKRMNQTTKRRRRRRRLQHLYITPSWRHGTGGGSQVRRLLM